MENYKHYSILKKTLKELLDSHKIWYSNEGPFDSNPNEGINGVGRVQPAYLFHLYLANQTE